MKEREIDFSRVLADRSLHYVVKPVVELDRVSMESHRSKKLLKQYTWRERGI